MRYWLLNLLRGVSIEEFTKALNDCNTTHLKIIFRLMDELKQASKNDHRDAKGRFAKRPEEEW